MTSSREQARQSAARQLRCGGREPSRTGGERIRGLVALAWAVCAGGSLFTTCQSQFRDAVVFGTRSYVLNVLLDPESVIEAILGSTDSDGEPNGSSRSP